ncbi:MAG TPA: MXAN_6640 family putative metalloprotease [Solirubrobacterales bacterium]
MRGCRKLIGASLAALALGVLIPAASSSAATRPFKAPQGRPTEGAARPTDHPDPNRNSYTVPEAPSSPACTRNFCVHWVGIGIDAPNPTDANGVADGDGIPDFVERVQSVAEHVYSVENGKLGWRDPKSDGRIGGGKGKTDVYLKEIGGALFGYAAPDRNQARKGHHLPRRLYGYLVLDNDYDSFEFPGTKPNEVLEVTVAHEYNHILQFGYDAYQDAWFAEATAVWMEDQVYGKVDDYLRYVRRWVHRFDTPLTATSIKEYGSAVWNQWLTRRYGRAIVRKTWARAIHTRPGGFSVSAYNSAIAAAGRSDFSRDFARFARDLAEWRTGSIFREGPLYPDVSRQGTLPLDGKPVERALNHTTFQLLRIPVRRGKAIVVRAVAPRGLSAGVALVGRIGRERHGRVVSRLRFKAHGGRMSVRLAHPSRFTRITAVLVNADADAQGYSSRRLDWDYLTDTAPFGVRARVVR